MGCSFSSENGELSVQPRTAMVIAADGSLKEYSGPATVSQVLGSEQSSCFVCSSDGLFFDAYIPAMDPGDALQAGQIYFVLPAARLAHPLSGSDMAALVITASTALSSKAEKGGGRRRRRRRMRVRPVAAVDGGAAGDGYAGLQGPGRSEDDGGSVSSVSSAKPLLVQKKMRRSASMRAKMALRRSFRMRLGTIEEGSE